MPTNGDGPLQASSEVVVKVSLLVGAASERRFDAEMQDAFKVHTDMTLNSARWLNQQ